MSSLLLCDDLILLLTNYLSDHDIISFLSVNRHYDLLKLQALYREYIYLCKIQKLRYADRFCNIFTFYPDSFPKCMTHFEYYYPFTWLENPVRDISKNDMPSVTHLRLKGSFNYSLENLIPKSVTHLTFGDYFNKDIKDHIPFGVTHLIFGDNFNQNIKGKIPASVIHLVFGEKFDQDITESIPSSVTYLELPIRYQDKIVSGSHIAYFRE
jgi:hypothetical protein